jgi:hypothetical protein
MAAISPLPEQRKLAKVQLSYRPAGLGIAFRNGHPAERVDRALNVAVIFQHNNDSTKTFETTDRGTIDAKRSLDLAKHFKQPTGSAIYFRVDGVDETVLSEFSKSKRRGNDKFGIQLIKQYF